MEDGGPSVGRRALLAGMGVTTTSAVAGCADRLWSQAEQPSPEQVSLTIKTVPADDDVVAASILSQLRENVEAAGIAVSHEPIARAELLRDVLLDGDYDAFICRHPGLDAYDAIRGLAHSQYVSERGWQNPFHFSDVGVDEYVETQRTSEDSTRENGLEDLFEQLEATAPYTTIAYPTVPGASDRSFDVDALPQCPLDYLDVLAAGSADRPLRVGVYGEGLVDRLNPIVVDRTPIEGALGVVYDPLVRRRNGTVYPWLAATTDWEETNELVARVTLREGLTWHDGTALDADDVAFTYRFLDDVSQGEIDGGLPAPRFRSRGSLVTDVTVEESRTVRFSFGDTTQPVAARAFTIPVLPEHVWDPRSTPVADRQPEALQTDNEEPIGSGLFAYAASTTDTELHLEPFDDHVLWDAPDRPDAIDEIGFDGIRFQVAPNAGSMIEWLDDGEIDIAGSPLPPQEVEAARDAGTVVDPSGSRRPFYMIGYNTHHPQLGNPNVRRLLSRLIDREHIVREFFDGMAEPPETYRSLFGLPGSDRTLGDRPRTLDFPGSDGELSVSRVRSLFEEVGYRYEDEQLLE